jgi:hypothetical protein
MEGSVYRSFLFVFGTDMQFLMRQYIYDMYCFSALHGVSYSKNAPHVLAKKDHLPDLKEEI